MIPQQKIFLLGTCFVSIILISVFASADDWTIDGDLVYVNDSNVFASAKPHTLAGSGWVYFNLTSKTYTGNVDVVWGFDHPTVRPTVGELYYPHTIDWNTTHQHDFYNVTFSDTTEPCDYGNEYNKFKKLVNHTKKETISNNTVWLYTESVVCFDSYINDGNDYRVYWDTQHSEFKKWVDKSSTFEVLNYDHGGMNKWYYVKNVPITQGQNYYIRAYIRTGINSNGKYWYAFKPSSETIHEAIANDHFYALDPWWNSSWNYRRNITISHTNIDSELTNFPIMVKLNSTRIDYSNTQNSGQDIRFTNSSGNELNYEIEKWNESGESFIWVSVPSVSSSSDTTISMYYGNDRASDGQNKEDVWDDDYKLVLHFTDLEDSTSNNNDASENNGVSHINVCKIGGCYDFDGTNDYISVTDSTSLGEDITEDLTVFAWVYNTEWKSNTWFYRIIEKGDNKDATFWNLGLKDGTGSLGDYPTFGSHQGWLWYHVDNDRTLNRWEMITGKYDGTTAKMFINESLINSTSISGSWSNTVSDVWIGYTQRLDSKGALNGKIDEVRISNVSRSDAWIKANYYSLNDELNTYGTEESGNEAPKLSFQGVTNYTPSNNSYYPFNATFQANITEPDQESMVVHFYYNGTLVNKTGDHEPGESWKYEVSPFLEPGNHNITWTASDGTSTTTEQFWYKVNDWEFENCSFLYDPVELGDQQTVEIDIRSYSLDNITSVGINITDPSSNLEVTNGPMTYTGADWTYDYDHTITEATENLGNYTVHMIGMLETGSTKNTTCIFLARDTTTPSITFVSPTPTNDTVTTGNSVTIKASVSDNTEVDTCILNWNGGNETVTPNAGYCEKTKITVDGTSYNFTMYVNDTSGNMDTDGPRYFLENTEPDPPSNLSPTGRQIENDHNITWTVGSDNDTHSLTYDYQIEENNNVFGSPYFDSGNTGNNYTGTITFGDGNNYTYRVRSNDGYEVSAWVTSNFTENTKPTATVWITPDFPEAGDTLTCNYNETDDEGDSVSIVAYEWYVNGVVQNHNASTLGAGFNNGDNVKCEVNLTDGYEYVNINSSTKAIGVLSVSSETYGSTVLEGETQTIKIDFQYNPSEVTNLLNVSLIWNGTSYGYTSLDDGTAEHFIYNKTFDTPEISGSLESVNFYWSYVINYTDGSQSSDQQSTTHQQNVTDLTLSNCTYGSEGMVLTFFLEDENTGDPVPGTFDMTVEATRENAGTFTYNWSLSGQSNYSICITPSDETVNVTTVESKYNANGYNPRRYYLRNVTISNTTPSTSYLYLNNGTDMTKVTFEVLDATGSGVSDVVTIFQRYYEGTNTYKGVAMDKTSTQGTGEVYVDIESIKYRVILEKNNEVKRTYLPMILRCEDDPCLNLELETSTKETYWEYMDKIAYSCTFTNSTRQLRCEIIDTSGVASNVCLDIDNLTVAGSVDYFRNCTHCSDVVMLTTIPAGGDYGYTWELEYDDGTTYTLTANTIESSRTIVYGSVGLILALIFILIMSFYGSDNPVTSIMTCTAGVVLTVLMDLLVIGSGAVVGIIVTAGILIWRMRNA